MNWIIELGKIWHWIVAALTLVLSLLASGHAILYKRDSRAAIGWIGFIWFVPLLGSVTYFIFGVNRIKRRAVSLRAEQGRHSSRTQADGMSATQPPAALSQAQLQPDGLARATAGILPRSLLPGNRVELLVNGGAAYPAMLDAIASARETISLSTYIFDRDEAGVAFARALGEAVRRGVEVRVLIDATGIRYSWPSILGELRREKIPHARFLRSFPLRRLLEMNLRNHRKILVVDGRAGFAGGMNIRVGHWLEKKPKSPVRDLHFRFTGPVVTHLQEAFADDWCFTTNEVLQGSRWFPAQEPAGPVIARGITDGPDEDFEKLRWTILAALSTAKESIRIATPYFLPDPTIIASLNLAAVRGVAVDILLPSRGNLPVVQWASTALWWQLLERGCRIWLSPPPFDHSKVFVVDGAWSLIGSTNWDPRSLRLNFEFNVECYDAGLARELDDWFAAQLQRSRQTSLAEMDSRSLPVRLRDGAARLLSPYL